MLAIGIAGLLVAFLSGCPSASTGVGGNGARSRGAELEASGDVRAAETSAEEDAKRTLEEKKGEVNPNLPPPPAPPPPAPPPPPPPPR